ncbi:MAG: thioredoxin domain-containing protein [Prolixibacteraceae bacterium]|jgi:thioredoxin|nr:thioredoxin domain-containing protein [Prolixibacteraceae bacterium]
MKIISTTMLIGLMMFFTNCHGGNPVKTNSSSGTSGNVIVLTNETFKQKVFNYSLNKEWKYEGTLPAIIDFYADWCGPCRRLSPMVEELAKKYDGKIIVYKVDTDAQQILAQSMGISSLPTLLFVPVKGQPRSTVGLVPNETLERAVHEILQVK